MEKEKKKKKGEFGGKEGRRGGKKKKKKKKKKGGRSTEKIQEWVVHWAGDVNGLLELLCGCMPNLVLMSIKRNKMSPKTLILIL